MSNRPKIFYGWWILLGSSLGMAFSIGLVYYAFSILVGPLEEQFRWSRTQVMDAPMIWIFVMALAMIPAGKLNDRFGPRIVMPAGAVVASLGLVMMAFMTSIWHYRIANAILALGMTGVSQPICMGTVARWFERLRGMAMGATMAGGAVGAFAASRLWPPLLKTYGTRGVYLACAGVGLVLAIYALLVMRRSPGDCGLQSYGAVDGPSSDDAGQPSSAEGLTSAQARKTANFWLILSFTLIANLAYNAVAMHFVPIYEAAGLLRDQASYLLGYTILLSFLGKILGGWLADHLRIRFFLSAIQVGFAIACASLLFAGAKWQLPLFVILWGTCLGFSAGAYAAIMPECFGTRELSTIMSQFMILQVFGVGFGPKISAFIYDKTQSYTVAFAIAAVLYLTAAFIVLATRPRFLSSAKRNSVPGAVETPAPSVQE